MADQTCSSSSCLSGHSILPKSKVPISDDILRDLIKFITRPELGRNFSLVNQRFFGFASAKMYKDNEHWVDGECLLTVCNGNGESMMIVPRGNGGFLCVGVPSVPPPPSILGFRGQIHFNGVLNDVSMGFFRAALPPPTTLYRISLLHEFFRANGALSPLQSTEKMTRFLEECVHHVELGGEEAYLSAFLAMQSVRGIRKLRATRFRDLFLGWLHQTDGGEWRQLCIGRKVKVQERNKLIKSIFQSLNEARSGSSPVLRFCIRMTVRHWGDPVERLPLRWLQNSNTGQCVVLVERRPADNTFAEMCIIRCPYAEAQQRKFIDAVTTLDDLTSEFAMEEPVCTVDVVPEVIMQESDTDGEGDNPVNTTPLHRFLR